jgi:archaellum biogenesis ATPase FlaH
MGQTKEKEMKKIMEFFDVKKPLFVEKELTGDDIHRFVDREELLHRFRSAIQLGKTCAVVGKQGSGKSSLLIKLMDEMKESMDCQYMQFSFPTNEFEKSRLHFLRATLRSLLYLIAGSDSLLSLFDKEEIAFDIKRLEYSIIIENHSKTQRSVEGELGGGLKSDLVKLLIPVEFTAKFAANRTKEEENIETSDYPIHNENTLYDAITKTTRQLKEPVVLFIDELDKVGRFPLEASEWDRELIKILELSREIMDNKKLIMVFSLQDELYEKLIKAKRGGDDVSVIGLINYFKKLEGFNLDFAKEAVDQSLKVAGYPGTKDELLGKGILEIVLDMVKGNPRLFMTYLSDLCIEAELKKQHTFTLDLLKNYLFELFKEEMSETRWQELVKKAS